MKFRFSYDITLAVGQYESSLNLAGSKSTRAFNVYGNLLQPEGMS